MITRLIVPIAALMFLGGCGHVTDIWSTEESGPESAIAGPAPQDAHCLAVARQRADDAQANGYGLEIETRVYSEAYHDCITQRAKLID